MLSQKQAIKWRKEFDKQLTLAEKKAFNKVRKFYKREYYKGVKTYIDSNNINYFDIFNFDAIKSIYIDIIPDVCMQFAVWFADNSSKYQIKEDPKDFTRTWQRAFNYYAGQVAASNVTLVSGTAKKSLVAVIRKLYRDPDFITKGAAERARILRSRFDKYSRYQAERLVRTESLRAANYGIEQSALKVYAGRKLKKQWIAFLDDKTRDWHAIVNNQIRDFDKPFDVDGEQMPRPGEGSARNVINCRCSMVPFPEDVESDLPFQ